MTKYPLAMTTDGKKKKSKLKKMKPEKFLEAARKLTVGEGDRDLINKFKGDIKNGEPMGPLKLYSDGTEDGRHRATAAEELGLDSVPVIDERTRKALGGALNSNDPNRFMQDVLKFSFAVLPLLRTEYLKEVPKQGFAHGGHVLEDDYPTHYLPEVGRQVMADGGASRFAAADPSMLVGTSAPSPSTLGAYTDVGGQKIAAPFVTHMSGGYPVYEAPVAEEKPAKKYPWEGTALEKLFGGDWFNRLQGYAEGGEVSYAPEDVERALQTAQEVAQKPRPFERQPAEQEAGYLKPLLDMAAAAGTKAATSMMKWPEQITQPMRDVVSAGEMATGKKLYDEQEAIKLATRLAGMAQTGSMAGTVPEGALTAGVPRWKRPKEIHHATVNKFDPSEIKPGSHFGSEEAAAQRMKELRETDYSPETPFRSLKYSYKPSGDIYNVEDIWGGFNPNSYIVDQMRKEQALSPEVYASLAKRGILTPTQAEELSYGAFHKKDKLSDLLLPEILKGKGISTIEYLNAIEDVGKPSWMVFDPESLKFLEEKERADGGKVEGGVSYIEDEAPLPTFAQPETQAVTQALDVARAAQPREATMTAYEPTLREKIYGAVAGTSEARPTAERSSFAHGIAELLGMAPVLGQAMQAQEAARSGDSKGVALAMLPMPGAKVAEEALINAAEKAITRESPYVIAYHGSPHSFDRFDISKIGTGEGAQAYGHGLYFADSEDVARSYRDALSQDVLSDAETDAHQALEASGWNRDAAHKYLDDRIARLQENLKAFPDTPHDPVAYKQQKDAARRVIDEWAAAGQVPQNKRGSMYQVRINADPEHFLDWDKPLSEQSHVSEALQRIGALKDDGSLSFMYNETPRRGGEMYERLTSPLAKRVTGGDGFEAASNALREAGIPGLKYLDQGSRGAGEGSSNYVVFDDKLVEILKKYGLVGLLGGTAKLGALTSSDEEKGLPAYRKGGKVKEALALVRK